MKSACARNLESLFPHHLTSLCRPPACEQALQLLKIIHDTRWKSRLEVPYSLNTVFHMQKNVNFSHILCLTASLTNNNHMDWNQEIEEATSCGLFIACSNNTWPMILHAHTHTHTQYLNVMWRNCLDALGFLNTKIWYVGCICLCLMWNTSDPSNCKSSYFVFVQYSPCHSESFNGFRDKLFYLVLLTQDIFYKTFCGYFFLMAQRYVICNNIADGHFVQQKTLLTYTGLLYVRQHN